MYISHNEGCCTYWAGYVQRITVSSLFFGTLPINDSCTGLIDVSYPVPLMFSCLTRNCTQGVYLSHQLLNAQLYTVPQSPVAERPIVHRTSVTSCLTPSCTQDLGHQLLNAQLYTGPQSPVAERPIVYGTSVTSCLTPSCTQDLSHQLLNAQLYA